MSDTLKKVLLGTVIGVVLMMSFSYVAEVRARREASGAGSGAAPAARQPKSGSGGGSFSQVPVNVLVAPVRSEKISFELEALGTTRANESVDVSSKVVNQITAIRFTEGQQVRRGEVLVELDAVQVRADLAAAEAALAESRSQYQRSRELYTTKILSDSQLEQIEATFKGNEARVAAARARVADTVIRAPFDGRVGLRRVSVGTLVSPGTAITTLDDTRTIKLDFTIPETFLSVVQPGLEISARSVAYPDETFSGKVSSVDTRVDQATRAVMVRALLPNQAGLLKPGMFLTVRLSRGAIDALLVPEESLVPEQGDMFVYVAKDGQAAKRKIRIGERRVGDVRVIEGLAAGEIVVTEGTQKLRDGATVTLQGSAAATTSRPSVP